MTEQVRFNSLLDRLEQVVSKLEKAGSAVPAAGAAAGGASAGAAVAAAPQVTAFDEYYETYVQPFIDTTRKIGGDLNQMADIFEKGYKALREVISIASQAKQPSDADLMPVFQPIVKAMEEAEKYRQSKRPADSFNHLSTISEGIKALGWPGVPKTPGPFVKEMLDAAQFYGTKVLVKYKATDKTHVDWVNQHKELLEQLQAYIKEYHTTGLKWNANGKSVKEVQAGASAAPAAKAPAPQAGAGAVPPPPPPGPPPPPPTFDATPAPAAAAGGAGMADVFAAINQGEGITSRLRKVKDEEKTKNRKDRVAVVTIDDSKTAGKESKAAASAKEEPAKIELVDNKKWVVQGQKNNKEIVIDQVDLKMSVYIYKCTGSLIQIKGKVNAIIVDTCTKTDVVFDDALSSIEFVNCKSVKFQVNGKVPTVNIDKTDGIAVYLSKASVDATIITAKSSEMNVNVPEGEDDYVE